MRYKAGVWIDHRKAVVVMISDDGEKTQQINSDAEPPNTDSIGGDTRPPDHSRGIVVENTQERKFESRLNTFYDAVLESLQDVDAVLIIGPGEAKGEFQKRLRLKKFPARVVELETADKMTDPQLAALVRQHFQNA